MNAAERLILEHQSFLRALVRNIASTLPHHVDYDELVAFGQVGLTGPPVRTNPAEACSSPPSRTIAFAGPSSTG
jgi:hypothetical protein